MIVSELIKELQEMNQDAIVVMASDAEGNGYSPLSGVYEENYLPESTYSGEVYSNEDLLEMAVYEEDVPEDLQKCVTLSPIN